MPAEKGNESYEESEIIEVNPCTEDGFVTLESTLKSKSGVERKEAYYDSTKMCETLKKFKDFSKIRCSREMGYAIIEYGDKRIHIFKQGKIIVRHAKDREDATKTLKMINKILSEAVLIKV